MNNNKRETLDFLASFLPKTEKLTVEVVICPPFTDLFAAADKLKGTAVKLGAQNMHWEEKGAFTGEISPGMLKEISCDYVIIGHSERRQYFAETDDTVNKKVKSALQHGLLPIVCVGESLAQREEGTTMAWVLSQVEKALKDITSKQLEQIVFAYEPIWAIGTGKTASAADAQEVIGAIRKKIAKDYNQNVAEKVRILYGGSVKPENIKELMGEADIDGALVGGASLKPDSFYALCSFQH
jgi:triosephosphate isomerase